MFESRCDNGGGAVRESAGHMLQGLKIGALGRFCGQQFPRHGCVRQ